MFFGLCPSLRSAKMVELRGASTIKIKKARFAFARRANVLLALAEIPTETTLRAVAHTERCVLIARVAPSGVFPVFARFFVVRLGR